MSDPDAKEITLDWRFLSMVAIFFALLTVLLKAAGAGQVAEPPLVAKVHQVKVKRLILQASYAQNRLATGKVEANQLAQISFERAGLLQQVLVDEGQSVQQGQLLARLDTSRLKAQMRELNASYAHAQADNRLAKLSEKRVRDLVTRGLESSQRLDEVTEAAKAAQANSNQISAKLDSLQLELKKSEIYSPFNGTLVARMFDAGSVVAAGQPLFSVLAEQQLDVRFALPPKDAANFKVGQTYPLTGAKGTVTGHLKSIVQRIKLNTRTQDMIFSLPANAGILPGELLQLAYSQLHQAKGAWVPKTALSNGVRGLWSLYFVNPKNNHIQRKTVEVLHLENNRAYVSGGLVDQAQLVLSGTHRLVPEQQVSIQPTTGT